MDRPVEAEALFDLGDDIGVQPLCAPVSTGVVALTLSVVGTGRLFVAGTTGEAGSGVHRGPLQSRDGLLDRSPRRELDDREVDHHDPEQRRDDQ